MARRLGLALALGFRILMLLGITWLIGLTAPLFYLGDHAVSGRDAILFGGEYSCWRNPLLRFSRRQREEGMGSMKANQNLF